MNFMDNINILLAVHEPVPKIEVLYIPKLIS